jgi:hypothetical protein
VDVKAKVELKTDVEEGRLRWNATLARKFFMKSFAVSSSAVSTVLCITSKILNT